MKTARSWKGRLRRRIVEARGPKLQRDELRPGIVSFTFDDFPQSAYRTGGRILEEAGVRGTYYAAMSASQPDPQRAAFVREDLQRLLHEGHELGCHTFSHLDCSATPIREVLRDVERNAKAVEEALGEQLVSFAYPKGRLAGSAKARLSRIFATCRGIKPGINRACIDLAHLHANNLYSDAAPIERARALIQDVASGGGWLLFYTHDVDEHPSRFGSNPRDLSKTLELALEAGCRVLPVRSALGALAFEG